LGKNYFSLFDKTRGVLSVLFVLGHGPEPSQGEIMRRLRIFDIGSTSGRAAVGVLHDLGLISSRVVVRGRSRVKRTGLTEKGLRASKLVYELFDILWMNYENPSK
jgi:hypothetical protein